MKLGSAVVLHGVCKIFNLSTYLGNLHGRYFVNICKVHMEQQSGPNRCEIGA